MNEKVTLPKILLGLLLFGCLAVISLFYFTIGLYDLIKGYIDASSVIKYNRGAMYGLGVGLGGISFFISFFILLMYRKISLNTEKRMIKSTSLGIVIIFIFPFVTDYTINFINIHYGYERCESAEYKYSWGIYKIRLYSKNKTICEQLIKSANIEHR